MIGLFMRAALIPTLLVLGCYNAAPGDETPTAREQFLAEWPKAYGEAEKINRDVDVEVNSTHENYTEDGSRWTEKQQMIVKSRGDMLMQQITRWPPEGNLPPSFVRPKAVEIGIDALNDQCSFSLRRQEDAPWKIIFVRSANDVSTRRALEMQGRANIFSPWHSLATLYPRLGFHLDSVEAADEGDTKLVKVSFTFSPQKGDEFIAVRHGWMLLDPKRRWAIRRSQLHLESPSGEAATAEDVIEYRGADDTIPVRETSTLQHEGKNRGVKSTIEFTKYERRVVPVVNSLWQLTGWKCQQIALSTALALSKNTTARNRRRCKFPTPAACPRT